MMIQKPTNRQLSHEVLRHAANLLADVTTTVVDDLPAELCQNILKGLAQISASAAELQKIIQQRLGKITGQKTDRLRRSTSQ